MNPRQQIEAAIRDVFAVHKLIGGTCDPHGNQCGWRGSTEQHEGHLAAMITDRLGPFLR